MPDDLTGRVALVTGGGRGIGLNVARELADAGARVAVTGRTGPQVEAAAREIGAIGITGDISREEDVTRMVAETERAFGSIDLLVANAGIGDGERAPIEEVVPAEWWHVFQVNVLGTFLCCRAVLPGMFERGEGRIVIVGSGASYLPVRHGAYAESYGPSKAAVGRFAEYLAAEAGPRGVAVFLISPGLVKTDMTSRFSRRRPLDAARARTAAHPRPRLGPCRPPCRSLPPRRARRRRAADRARR